MKNTLLSFVALLLLSQGAQASEQTMCSANKGAFLTGTVTTGPRFQSASHSIDGIKLSHTILYMRADQDGRSYQVAMDNVYAVDYVRNATSIPTSLAALKAGTRVEVCGEKYSDGTGIHWVHSNCGATPTATAPNGWVKKISTTGTIGANLERSQAYCYLWN
ncbi:hypothetical protein [Massilia rhizosphaerae]|uniref:hypothetical protein n=1 Tax=Massilia rhizosphaerae TaxID=2784389 RepID=UPI001E4DDB37|nr:hypothetical protein [Massilia rhizosphaerae]